MGKNKALFSLFLISMWLGVVAADSAAPSPFSYVIGPGDELDIQVWRHPDFSSKIIVRPDGKFSFPIVGEVSAMNKSIPELNDILTTGLSVIFNQPVVTINVTAIQSQKVFVLGEVNRPGVYPLEGRMSVIEALSKAAGYHTDTAALNSVMVIRRSPSGQAKAMRLNISSVIQKADMGQNIDLNPGDIVFVPKTFIANVTTFIQEFFTKTDPVVQYYLDVYNAANPGKLTR